MKKIKYACILTLILGTTIQACSHAAANRRIDEKLAREPSFSSAEDLDSEAGSLLENDAQLTPEQRDDLRSLWKTTSVQLKRNAEDSRKLHSLLMQEIISSDSSGGSSGVASRSYDPDEVALIKQRLRDAEKQRILLIFNMIDRFNRLLRHQAVLRNGPPGYIDDMPRGRSEGRGESGSG